MNLSGVCNVVSSCFSQVHILVVGDLMLDLYEWGRVERISPEAPVPIVRIENETLAAGGAANVALNLAAMGCTVSIAGLLGDDQDGARLTRLLHAGNVDTKGVVLVNDRPTTTKTRIMGAKQQILRLDREHSQSITNNDENRLLSQVTKLV